MQKQGIDVDDEHLDMLFNMQQYENQHTKQLREILMERDTLVKTQMRESKKRMREELREELRPQIEAELREELRPILLEELAQDPTMKKQGRRIAAQNVLKLYKRAIPNMKKVAKSIPLPSLDDLE